VRRRERQRKGQRSGRRGYVHDDNGAEAVRRAAKKSVPGRVHQRGRNYEPNYEQCYDAFGRLSRRDHRSKARHRRYCNLYGGLADAYLDNIFYHDRSDNPITRVLSCGMTWCSTFNHRALCELGSARQHPSAKRFIQWAHAD